MTTRPVERLIPAGTPRTWPLPRLRSLRGPVGVVAYLAGISGAVAAGQIIAALATSCF